MSETSETVVVTKGGRSIKFKHGAKVFAGSNAVPDRLKIRNPNPNFRYRWMNKRYREEFGMQACPADVDWKAVKYDDLQKGEEIPGTGFSKSVDGIVRKGELFLGRLPKEQAEIRNESLCLQNLQRSEDIDSSCMYELEKLGKSLASRPEIQRTQREPGRDKFLAQKKTNTGGN